LPHLLKPRFTPKLSLFAAAPVAGRKHLTETEWNAVPSSAKIRRRAGFASLCDNAQMTGPPPREPLWLPPNCRDVTAEKVGTVIGIVGATAAKPG
jgi:hypothetical protein